MTDISADFQFALDGFFTNLDSISNRHGNVHEVDEEIIERLRLRAADLEDQYRDWIEEAK